MSRKYKFRDQEKLHFVSFATVYWIDLFVRQVYTDVVLASLKHCQKTKGLEVYAWCIMPSHIHLIIGTKGKAMQDIVQILLKKLIPIPILFLIISCGEQGVVERFENGNIKKQILSVTDSTQVERRFSPKGELVAELHLKDSVKHGISRVFDTELEQTYELRYDQGRTNINWRVIDSDGNKIQVERSIVFQGPDTIEYINRFEGTAHLAKENLAKINAYFYCAPNKSGYLYSKAYSSLPKALCDVRIPIDSGKAILSFRMPNPRTREYEIVIEEHLIDDLFLPYHGILTLTGI